MTLIIRAPGVLTNPRPGSIILPSLGVDGVVARLHARLAPGAVGASPAVIPGGVNGGKSFSLLGGAPTVQERGGVRVLRLSNTDRYATENLTTLPKARSLAMAVFVSALPSATHGVIQTAPSSVYAQLAFTGVSPGACRLAVYGGNNTFPQTAVGSLTVGWHTLIGVMGDDGTGAVALDGVITSGALVYNNPAVGVMQVGVSYGMALDVVDAVTIDHALNATEIASLHSALHAQLP